MKTYWKRNKIGEEKGFGKENVRKKFRQEEESKNREFIYSGTNHCRNEQSSFPFRERFPFGFWSSLYMVHMPTFQKKIPARFHPGVLLVRTKILTFVNKKQIIMSKSRKTTPRKQASRGKELKTLEDILNCNDAEQLTRACMEARNRIPKETRDIIERMLKSEGFIF